MSCKHGLARKPRMDYFMRRLPAESIDDVAPWDATFKLDRMPSHSCLCHRKSVSAQSKHALEACQALRCFIGFSTPLAVCLKDTVHLLLSHVAQRQQKAVINVVKLKP